MSDEKARNALAKVGGAPAKLADFRSGLDAMSPQFASALEGTGINPDHFLEVATTAVLDNPKLLDCEPASLIRALRRSAALSLRPDNEEACVIPYKGQATFQPMFKGIVRLMKRTGQVKKVEARVVYHGDDFDYEYGLHPRLSHRPTHENRGGIHAAYAILWLTNGETQFEVMDREDLDTVKEMALRKNNGKLGPAWENYEGEMVRKIVVKRLSKYVDLDPRAAAAIRYDDALAMGEPFEPADHVPEADWRTTDQRVQEHADRQTAELRDRLQASESRNDKQDAAPPAQEDEGGGHFDLTQKLGFGKKYPNRTWLSLLEEGEGARGYITHFVLTEKFTMWSDEQKAALQRAVDAWDASQGGKAADEAPAATLDADGALPAMVDRAKGALDDAFNAGKLNVDDVAARLDEIDLLASEGNLHGVRDVAEELEKLAAGGEVQGNAPLWPEDG